jgi:hypothetical protein
MCEGRKDGRTEGRVHCKKGGRSTWRKEGRKGMDIGFGV